MKLTLISGSHRQASETTKVAKFLEQKALEQKLFEETFLFELAENSLPLWDESIFNAESDWRGRLAPIARELNDSDALVILTPEWHGMVPSGLKNFFLLWSNGELAHKPALIVAVSASSGGAYPVAELRMSSYKNNRICYLPEHLIIRNVKTVFNANTADNDPKNHSYLESRVEYCLKMLCEYAKAFRQIRASGVTDLIEFKNGM